MMPSKLIEDRVIEIYHAIAYDMGEHDLDEALDTVCDRLYDELGPDRSRREVVRAVLAPYF